MKREIVNTQRRNALQGSLLLLISWTPVMSLSHAASLAAEAGAEKAPPIQTIAVRLWPAKDYTRLTLELSAAIEFNFFTLKSPDRLVIDIDNIRLDSTLSVISKLVVKDDPYLSGLRAAQYTPSVVRLVLDLKQPIKPQVFSADPIAQYHHRFFVDLYPMVEDDPLLALLLLQNSLPESNISDHEIAQSAPKKKSPQKTKNKLKPSKKKAILKPASPAVKKSKRRMVVVLDPGHGGEDPGAVGSYGTYEKNIVLAIAKLTQKRLEALGMVAILTRDRDFFIPLSKRVRKARQYKADLFISIHADAFTRKTATGSSIYVVSDKGASSAAARWIAKRENRADKIGGILLHKDRRVANTLLDLAQSRTRHHSHQLAKSILGELSRVNRLHKKKVEKAGFAVLKAPDIPSALIETAFISNPTEERRLNNRGYQESLAQAISRGIHFFGEAIEEYS